MAGDRRDLRDRPLPGPTAHVDLNDAELGAEPAILGATDCPFFMGRGGEHFTVATSLVGSRTFPSWLRAMRRPDLADDPRFATATARQTNFAELHRIVQNWILAFADLGALDAQLDEAKIAFGEVRSLKQLSEMEWPNIGARFRRSPTAMAAAIACQAAGGASRASSLRRSASPPFRASTTAQSLPSSASGTSKLTTMLLRGRSSACQSRNPQTRGTSYDPFP